MDIMKHPSTFPDVFFWIVSELILSTCSSNLFQSILCNLLLAKVTFEVPTASDMNMFIFWDVAWWYIPEENDLH
jgi:hypothetical protein